MPAGRWVLKTTRTTDGYVQADFYCSACGIRAFHNGAMVRKYKYCFNCGTKMQTDGYQEQLNMVVNEEAI